MKQILTPLFCLLHWALLAQNVPTLIKDLYTPLKSSHPHGFIQADSFFFFKTDELPNSLPSNPRSKGIWLSDGTAAGTIAIAQDTISNRAFSDLAVINEQVFFIKAEWSDDFDPGVFRLFRATAFNAQPEQMGGDWTFFSRAVRPPTVHQGKVFFVKNDQIWQSDGTNSGTQLYFSPPLDPAPNFERRVGDLVSNGDSLYFILYRWQLDGPNSTGDLWSISGNAGDPGTPLRETVYMAVIGGGGFTGQSAALSDVDGRAILTTRKINGAGGNQIFGPVTTISPGFKDFSTERITVNGGSLDYKAIIADNGLFVLTHEDIHLPFGLPDQRHNELWVTPPNTTRQLLKEFAGQFNGVGFQIGTIGSLVFFAADDSLGNGQEIWRSDGSPNGTFLLRDIRPGPDDSQVNGFARDSNHIYFSAFDGTAWGIWQSDGVPGGTVKLTDFPTTFTGSPIREMFMQEGVLYFSGNDGVAGFELWKYQNGVVSTVQWSGGQMDFQLFPNPADEAVVIKMRTFMSAAEGRIFDQLGRLVKVFPVEGDTLVVDLSDLKSGVYFLEITGPGGRAGAVKFFKKL